MPAKLPKVSKSTEAYLYTIWLGLNEEAPTRLELEGVKKFLKNRVTVASLQAWFANLKTVEEKRGIYAENVQKLLNANEITFCQEAPTNLHKIVWWSTDHPNSGERLTASEAKLVEDAVMAVFRAGHFFKPRGLNKHPHFELDSSLRSSVREIQNLYDVIKRLELYTRLFKAASYTRSMHNDKRRFQFNDVVECIPAHFINLMLPPNVSSMDCHFDTCMSVLTSILVIANKRDEVSGDHHDLVELDKNAHARALDMDATEGAIVDNASMHCVVPAKRELCISFNTFYYPPAAFSLQKSLERAEDKAGRLKKKRKSTVSSARRAAMDAHFAALSSGDMSWLTLE